MAFDLTNLKAAYVTAINARFAASLTGITSNLTIDKELALNKLEQYCAALTAEYNADGVHLASYSVGGRSVSYRTNSGPSDAAEILRRQLDRMIGRDQCVEWVDLSGQRGVTR